MADFLSGARARIADVGTGGVLVHKSRTSSRLLKWELLTLKRLVSKMLEPEAKQFDLCGDTDQISKKPSRLL